MLLILIVRLAYVALWCPYTLVEDEAHYWEWSRRLGWSYYSKGPGIAWLIAASNSLFGAIGMADTELAVRAPAAVCAAVLALAVAGLATDALGDRRAGFYAAAVVSLAPALQMGGLILTIDMPMLACWGVAAWAAWRALHGGSRGAWIALGLAIALGFLVKYTMLLIVPGIVLHALLSRRSLALAPRAGRWIAVACVVALLGLVPVALWNHEHGWPTVRHLIGHLGLRGGDMPAPTSGGGWRYDPRWTLGLIGEQLAMIGPALALMALGAVRARRAGGPIAIGSRFTIHVAAPILLFYLAVTLVTEAEGNWPLPGFVTLFALAGWCAARVPTAGGEPRERPRRDGVRIAWRATLILGLVTGIAMTRVDLVKRGVGGAAHGIARLLGGDGTLADRVDRAIPLGRLMGARELASDLARLAEQVRERTGRDPTYIADHYGRASVLAFYIPKATGRDTTVYCASRFLGGRRTQYDYWPATDLARAELADGRPAVLSGARLELWRPAFEAVEEVGVLPTETKRGRMTFVGIGFRGFPPEPKGGGR